MQLRRSGLFLLFSALMLPGTEASSAPLLVHLVARNSSTLEDTERSLTVGDERMRFECADFECLVSANYDIYSQADTEYNLEFMLPSSHAEQIWLNNNEIVANAELQVASPSDACVGVFDCLPPNGTPAASKAPERWDYHCWHGETKKFCEEDLNAKGTERQCVTRIVDSNPRCEEARMKLRVALHAGWNSLRVKYRQPLEITAWDPEAGQKAPPTEASLGFSYILYPLEDWQHGDNFELSIVVRWSLPKRSIFGRLFLPQKREIACGSVHREDRGLAFEELPADDEPKSISDSGRKQQELTYTFTNGLPRIFGCRAGAMELGEDFSGDLGNYLKAAEKNSDS